MGLLGRIRGWLGGKDTAELQREGGWDVLGGISTKPWTRADGIWHDYSRSDLENAYAIAAVIQACVKLKATVAAEAWMQVGVWEDEAWRPHDDHAFYDLMRRPNGQMDGREFTWNVVTHVELTGVSFVAKFRNEGRQVTGVWPFPSSSVSEVKDKRSGELRHYRVNQGGGRALLVDPVDMFVVRYPDPSDPCSGASPLRAALRDLQIDEARTNLLIEILTNTHFASTVFQRGQGMWSDPEKKALRAALKDKIGPGRRGDALFLAGQGSTVTFPTAPTDIDWPGTSSLAETRICAAFGVPPILVGLRAGLERSTYSNFEQALRAFYRLTMKPLWNLLASAYERGLLIDEGDEETEVEPYLNDIAELQEDLDSQHARARADFHGGGTTLNEYIEKIGGEPLGKDGELRVMPMNLLPFVSQGEMIEAEEPEPATAPKPDEDEDEERGRGEPDEWEGNEPGGAGEGTTGETDNATDSTVSGKSIRELSGEHVRALIGAPGGGLGDVPGGGNGKGRR